MKEKANAILEALMRGGYAARGVVYFIVGAIALYAAFSPAHPENSTGAMQGLSQQPFGMAMLAIVAFGLFAYMLWRFADALLDLQRDGHGPIGVATRAGNFLSGVVQAALGVTAVTIIVEGARAARDKSAVDDWTAQMMAEPYGRWLVIALGLGIVGGGVFEARNALIANFRNDLERCETTERFAPAMRLGLAAKAFVLFIIGGLFIYAGWTIKPEEAVGVGQALLVLERHQFGRALLGFVGAGMIGFAVYCWIYTKYRTPSRLRSDDVPAVVSPGEPARR